MALGNIENNVPQKKKFDVVEEKRITIHNWDPKEGGYDNIGEVLDEIRDFDPGLHQELTTIKADRENSTKFYRFYRPVGNAVGVLTFDKNAQGKYEPGALNKTLRVVIDGNELKGIEEVAEYYFAHPEEISN